MPSFKNFANGGMEYGNSSGFSSVRHKQVRDNCVGSRIEKVWATDFERCESREDYEKYISKYGKYESNKYISQAQAKIESLDAEEKARIERAKAAPRIPKKPIVAIPNTGGSGTTSKSNILQTCMEALVWIVIIGGVGLYSYNQYKQETNETTTDIVISSQPSQHQDSGEQYTTHTHSEQTYEPENSVVESEPEPEPQEIWWDCNICGATGRCQLCFGLGSCGVCGGSGQVFSVFYGDEVGAGRMTDCGNCGGTGRCPSCEGTGACFACKGRGKCKLDE